MTQSSTYSIDPEVLTRDQRVLVEDLVDHAGGARQAGLARVSKWRDDRFRNVRDALDEAAWITVRRGIMTLAPIEGRSVPPARLDRLSSECDLEQPASNILELMATRELGLQAGTYRVINTARAGGKDTGGRWSRPDLTLVTVQRYTWLRPQHRLRVVTFELKLGPQLDVSAIHEALAHRAQATSAWVMADSRCLENSDRFERVKREAERHGVGLVVAKSDPATLDASDASEAYDVKTYPTEVEPHPGTLDEFVDAQLSSVHDWLLSQYGRT